MYGRVCRHCGANLDPQEKCDCIAEREKKEKKILSMYRISDSGQIVMREELLVSGL